MKNMKYSYAYILLYIHNCIFLFLLFSNLITFESAKLQ